MPLPSPTQVTGDLARAGMELFSRSYSWEKGVRSLGLRAAGLLPAQREQQLSFLEEEARRERELSLERAVDTLRARFGSGCVQRARLCSEPSLDLEAAGTVISSLHPDFLRVEEA